MVSGVRHRFHVGEVLREEMRLRGWDERRLARSMGRGVETVQGLLEGRLEVREGLAHDLAKAFQTSAFVWLALQDGENAWRLLDAQGTSVAPDASGDVAPADSGPVAAIEGEPVAPDGGGDGSSEGGVGERPTSRSKKRSGA